MEQAKVQIDTGLDLSGFEKGYSELNKELIKAQSDIAREAGKVTAVVEKEAQEQIEKIRKTENEKIAEIEKGLQVVKETEQAKIEEIKRSLQEQIAAVKETPGLDKAAMREQIQAIKETENAKVAEIKKGIQEQIQAGKAKIQAVKDNAKVEESIVKAGAAAQIKIIQDQAKKQLQAVSNGYKKSAQAVKDFVSGAGKQLLGFDQILASMGQGPAAWGKLVVDMGKKAIAALNEMAAAYREQEAAEIALTNAARNNPLLSDNAVRQLNQYANEMQRLTGLDSVMITQTQTRLANLGRNQQQIKDIVRVAADMAAGGVMDFDSAVNELNNSLNGMVKTSGRLYPELKDLSKEALASGQAIEIIAGKVAGNAAEAMKTGAGSVKAYENALGNLKKVAGEGWENSIRPMRDAITDLIYSYTETTNLIREFDRLKGLSKDGKLTETQQKIDYINAQLAVFENKSTTGVRAFNTYVSSVFEGLKNFWKGPLSIIDAWKVGIKGVKEIRGEQKLNTEEHKKQLLEELAILEERNAKEIDLETIKGRATEAEKKAGEEILASQRAYIYLIGAAKALKENNIEAYESAKKMAAVLTEQAENEARAISAGKDKRKENQEALEKEIAAIKEQAKIERKSVNSAEVRTQILNARKNAYLSLVKEIGAAGAQEQRTLAQLQAESYRLAVEAANKLTEDNKKNMDNQIKWIEKKAAAEGKAKESMEVQNEILDAQVNAYNNQLKILQDLIDGTGEEETARRKALQAQWDHYKAEVKTAETQKKLLGEMIKKQEELNKKAAEMYKEAEIKIDKTDYERQLNALLALQRNAVKKGSKDIIDINKQIADLNLAYATKKKKEEHDEVIGRLKEQLEEQKKLTEENNRLGTELVEEATRQKNRWINAHTQAEKNAAKVAMDAADAAVAANEKERISIQKKTDELNKYKETIEKAFDIEKWEDMERAYFDIINTAAGSQSVKAIRALSDEHIANINRVRDAELAALEEEQEKAIKLNAELEATKEEYIRILGYIPDEYEAAKEIELKAESTYEKAKQEIRDKYNAMARESDRKSKEAIKKANEEMFDHFVSCYEKMFGMVQSIVNSISATWANAIEYDTNERLKANDKIIQSDEDRARKEKEIQIEAAQKKYEADMFTWAATVTMVSLQATMAAISAFTKGMEGAGPVLAGIYKGMAVLEGLAQISAAVSAKPKPPRFHSGGQVPGVRGTDVLTVQKAREVDLTPRQFQNTMQAISNLANTRTGNSTGGLTVNIKNTASNKVEATPRITPEGLEITIEGIVNKGFRDGTFDRGIAAQQSSIRGDVFL